MSDTAVSDTWFQEDSAVFIWTSPLDIGDNYEQARQMARDYWGEDVRIINVRPSYSPVGIRVTVLLEVSP